MLMAVLLMAGSAQAASFDCKKATSKMERAVCGTPRLSGLDESLAAAYTAAKSRLSPNAVKTFVTGQSSWLRFTSTYCFTDYNAHAVTPGEASQCLTNAYEQRIKEIAATGTMVAGFKSYPALDNRIKVSAKEQSVYTVERRYVQLDDNSALAIKLNEYLAFKDKIVLDDSRGSESYTVNLAYPSKDWLYKQTTASTSTGAYPETYTTCGLYAISLGRPLLIGDVFAGQEWTKIAESAARRHFAALAKNNPEFTEDMVMGYDQLQPKPDQEFSYCFTADGMYIDGFMPHAAKVFDGVTIKWNTFDKVLTPYAGQQIRSLSVK
jgi:uncharacterized protein